MNVGLPGTGIGGLFYLLLVAWMPVHEMWKTLHGTGSVRGWKIVSVHMMMATGILSALWGEAWFLQRGLHWASAQGGRVGDILGQLAGQAHVLPESSRLIALGSVLTLVTVLLVANVGSRLMRLRGAGTLVPAEMAASEVASPQP